MPQEYTVKAGDTLNKIAQNLGYKNYKEAGISGYDNPDKIYAGQKLTIGGGNNSQEIPGVGTLTIKPKAVPSAAPGQAPDDDLTGAYERYGINPPSVGDTPQGYQAPSVDGLPGYPSGYNAGDSVNQILTSYQSTLDQINSLEEAIAGSVTASDEERALQRELASAKSRLNTFDLDSLRAQESIIGEGRGKTLANIGLQSNKISRARALDRLGLAQEVESITNLLGITKEERQNLGEMAQTRYNLATKKLDIALGIQNTIKGITEDEQDRARQYLLDVVDFASGKTYGDLDETTQQAITNAVANSPITLNMVKTALDKGAQADAGELRTVSGLGVVQIVPDGQGGFSYNVVVPESGNAPTNDPNNPTFEEYVVQQGYGSMSLMPSSLEELRSEYDATYGGTNVSLGKLSSTNKNDLNQAGLTSAPSAVQSYFLNTPPQFRDEYQRQVASGQNPPKTLSELIDMYTTWYNRQGSSGTRDWDAILGGGE